MKQTNTPLCSHPAGLVLLACLATLLWGTAFPTVKSGYALFQVASTADRLVFAGVRFFESGLAVILMGSLLRRRILIPGKSAMGRVCVLALVQTALQYLFFYIAIANTTGAKGSILNSTSAFLGVLLAHFFTTDDRMTIWKAVGCLAGLAGVIAVNMGPMGAFSLTGDGAMLLAALAEAGAGLVSKWTTQRVDSVTAAGWQLALGGGTLWIVGAVCGGAIHGVSLSAWILLGYLVIISSISYSIWTVLLKYHPVAKVSMYLSLIPVFGVFSSGIVLGEPIFTLRNLFGVLFVSAGIIIVNVNQKGTWYRVRFTN